MHSQDEALKFSKSKYEYYFRKVLVLLILVTLLSLLLSYFTSLSFLHSYTYYSSSFMIPYLTQTFERKYMFVLCNGILVFLAGLHNRTSCSSNLPSEFQMEVTDTNDNLSDEIMNVEEDFVLQPEASVRPLSEKESEAAAAAAAVTEEEPVSNEANHLVAAGLAEDGDLDEEIETENEEEESSGSIIVKEEEGDTESEGPGSNTEELNKKIEEFIRKMKEELQLEAQQQYIIAA